MATVRGLLAAGAARLGSQAEARTLLAHVLGVETATLLLVDAVDEAAAGAFEDLVERRASGLPLQHLTGVSHFRTISVAVGPGVFIPRPETEVMTGWALERLAELPGRPLVVELCAGSGAISKAIATEHPAARVHAVEISDDAIDYLRTNVAETGVEVTHADMAQALAELDGTVDLVIANPPYIPLTEWAGTPAEVRDHDPLIALFSGQDGLDALRVVADVAARLLRPGGWLAVEHADVQGDSAPGVLIAQGCFRGIADHRDLNGRPRYVVAQRAGRMGV